MLTNEQVEAIRSRMGIQSPDLTQNRVAEFEAAWAEPEKPQTFGEHMLELPKKTLGVFGAVGKALTSSERGLGETIGDVGVATGGVTIPFTGGKTIGKGGATEQASENLRKEQDMQRKVMQQISENKAQGKDTSALEWALMRSKQAPSIEERVTEQTPSVDKTIGQVAGELGGTALDALAFGTFGKGADLMKTGKLAKGTPLAKKLLTDIAPKARTPFEIMKQAGKASVVGGGVGYGYDVSIGLQEGEGAGAALPGFGTVLGAGIPLVAGLVSAGKQIVKPSAEAALRDYKGDLEGILGGKESGRKFLDKSAKKGKNPVDVLVHKASLGDQVPIDVIDGVYKTDAGVEKLWRDVDHLDDMLTEGLKGSPERLSLKDLEKQAIKSLHANPDIKAAGTALEAERKARKVFGNLRASYGDIVPLDVANQIKSGQWKEARSIFAKTQPNYAGNTNFQIGQVLKTAIEGKMKDAPVGALNHEIGSLITTAEALGKLNNSVAKGGKIGKYFFRTIGAIAGAKAGPVGTMLGAGAGELAARVAQQIPANNPFRAAVLAKISQGSPKVVREFAEYLAREEAAKAKRLALPAPGQTPVIQMGGEVLGQKVDAQGNIIPHTPGESGVELIKAEKGQMGVDPKTGRFMKTYKSGPSNTSQSGSENMGGATNGFGLNNPQTNAATPNANADITIDGTIPEELNYGNALETAKQSLINYAKNPKLGLALEDVSKLGYKNTGELSTKLLAKLEGKTTVSKQFISDLTNQPELKQAERDLIRDALKGEGDSVNVTEFANKVKTELLPLKIGDAYNNGYRYENINLPDELRGPVANYQERIYQSPIKTSAGDVHFGSATGDKENYFAHTRIEDLPGKPGEIVKGSKIGEREYIKGDTRRVIELQSDLFQKGRLEREVEPIDRRAFPDEYFTKDENGKGYAIPLAERKAEIAKLEPYRNTWHERIIREEVAQAAKDGKTKLQFPTGETAMKIEGLGQNTDEWVSRSTDRHLTDSDGATYSSNNTPLRLIRDTENGLYVGQPVRNRNGNTDWIITDVLGDGKFKAVQKEPFKNAKLVDGILQDNIYSNTGKKSFEPIPEHAKETFDISGKVDTNNPIYRFYEKEVGRYLTNKYGAKRITDAQGVEWYEIPVDKKIGKLPVEAFGIAPLLTTDDE